MKWNLLAVMLMLWLGQAFAQTEPLDYKNQLGLQLGYNQGLLEDLNFSSLHYKDREKIYRLTFDKENWQSLFFFEGAYSSGAAKTSLDLDSLTINYLLIEITFNSFY